MSRYIDVSEDSIKSIFKKLNHRNVYPKLSDEMILRNYLDEFPTADVIEADKVQKTVETYCTDHCYHNAHCMEMYKDVDDAVEYLERKCEKCPLRELRDLDMR